MPNKDALFTANSKNDNYKIIFFELFYNQAGNESF